MAAAVAWLAYARAATPGQRFRVMLLAALRFAAVLLVAALALGAPSAPPRPAPPIIALDASASWRRAGGEDSATVDSLHARWQAAASALGASDDEILLVGDSLRAVSRATLTELVPADAASRIRPAIDRAAALGRPLTLITDGEVDDVEAFADAPLGSAVRVVPRPPRLDLAIADLTVPAAATAGDTLQISALLASGAQTTVEGRLVLSLDGVETASVPVPVLPPFSSSRLTLPLPLPRGARTAVLKAIIAVPTDVEPRNDTLSAAIEIGDRPVAVFVSTAPDLDVRELLVVLRGALSLPTRAYLRLAPGVWREEGSLAPISEADVRSRAAAAGMLIVHGDTSWAPPVTSDRGRGARALWTPAPPTALARAGEVTRAAEWYASSAPPSPLSTALSGLPWDSLPPLTLAGLPRGAITVLAARLGKRGEPVPAIAARDDAGMRTLVISGSGYAGWALRGGRSAEAFTALWGSIFDWLAVGRGDQRAARPSAAWMRAGDPVQWRRGGADSVVTAVITRRSGPVTAASSAPAGDTVRLRFGASAVEAQSGPLPAGIYDVRSAGGSSVLVVNASREWIPRAPTAPDGPLSRGSLSSDAPRLADHWWPFVAALVLLSVEWVARRLAGLR